MFYNSNGIPTSDQPAQGFWVQYHMGDFFFKEGDITSDIDIRCVELRYEVANHIFGSTKEYYRLSSMAPMFFPYAGIDAELKISREEFATLVGTIEKEEVSNKLLYYYDMTNLIGTLQNGVLETKYLVGQFYKTLNENDFLIGHRVPVDSGLGFASGIIVTNITSLINHIFINLYSQLDFITKIIYEIENLPSDFSTYPKLRSKDTLFGEAKKTSLASLPNSLFEPCDNIRIVSSLRNEIVHNSSIDSIPKVYQVIDNKKIIEKFIFLPDFQNGHIKGFRSRRRFFYDENKLNDILPELVMDFWKRLKTTLDAIKWPAATV